MVSRTLQPAYAVARVPRGSTTSPDLTAVGVPHRRPIPIPRKPLNLIPGQSQMRSKLLRYPVLASDEDVKGKVIWEMRTIYSLLCRWRNLDIFSFRTC